MRISRLALLVSAALAAGGATMLVARAGTNDAATTRTQRRLHRMASRAHRLNHEPHLA